MAFPLCEHHLIERSVISHYVRVLPLAIYLHLLQAARTKRGMSSAQLEQQVRSAILQVSSNFLLFTVSCHITSSFD